MQGLGKDPIDGGITDLRMPDMNGDEPSIRICERDSDIPTIVVTSYSNDALPLTGNIHVFTKLVYPLMLVSWMSEAHSNGTIFRFPAPGRVRKVLPIEAV